SHGDTEGKRSCVGFSPTSCRIAKKNYLFCRKESGSMKKKQQQQKRLEQPEPFTPGVTKAMVRQHAFEMFRDKLPDHPLTLEDWVLAEKDLVNMMETTA